MAGLKFLPTPAGKSMTQAYEGWKDKPYLDTLGNPTIGYGFNINQYGSMLPQGVSEGKVALTKDMAQPIFEKLYGNAINNATAYLGNDTFNKLSEGQKNVIIDMAYNLGLPKLNEFVKMKEALISGDYNKASQEMKNSKWYNQVGDRAKNHIKQILGDKQ